MTDGSDSSGDSEDPTGGNPTSQDHECQFCHESFDSEEAMREHVKDEHSSVEEPDEDSGDS